MTEEEAVASVKKRMGEERGEEFCKAFRKAYPNAPSKEMTYIDTGFRASAVNQALAKSRQGGAPAYLYLFTWKPENNALGASHGMELPFMLHNVNLQREMTGASPSAYKFEKLISSIWLSFIKTGNPNVKGLPKWEPFTEQNGVTMILDNKCYPLNHHDSDLLKLSRPIW
jgi:para-nitrobenzyl esterase